MPFTVIAHIREDAPQSHLSALLNPISPEFIIVIFIHYKPRIAVAILDL